MSRNISVARRTLAPIVTFAVVLAVWSLAVRLTGTSIFPSPSDVARALGELWERGVLASYARDSLLRVASGYGVAVLLGIPIGLVLGWFPPLARAFAPLIQMLRPISPLAWMPLAIIWFGIGNTAPVFLIFLASFFPIVVATMNGVGGVPLMYVRAARNFGLGAAELLRRVIFPAILPKLITGLRLGLGIAWLVVVAAEMIAVDSGLGYLIIDARNAGKRYDLVVAGMFMIGLIGLVLDLLLRVPERMRPLAWGFQHRQ